MRQALVTAVLVLGCLSAFLVAVLLACRVTASARRRHQEAQRHALRLLLLTALLEDPPESTDALRELRSRTGRAWDLVEDAAFALLPKIKGEAHGALVALLIDRGAADRAITRARSRSMVRRARGAYQLGALASAESVPVLLRLLSDRHFLVRRGAVRALGSVGDPAAVRPLLDTVVADDALTRDVAAAIARIGAAAAPTLRDLLEEVLVPGHQPPAPAPGGPPVRRAAVAAQALGLVGDVGDTRLLVRALEDEAHPTLAEAAATALGQLGSPDAVQPLLVSLATPRPQLRLVAAKALGSISDKTAAPGLAAALTEAGHEDARAAAAALLRLGAEGLAALERSESPYAAEALAVHSLTQSA